MNLRSMRKSKNMTLVAASLKIGIDHTSLGRIERGIQNPSCDTLKKIAEIYETTPGGILEAIHAKNSFGQISNKSLPEKVDRLPDGLPKNSLNIGRPGLPRKSTYNLNFLGKSRLLQN